MKGHGKPLRAAPPLPLQAALDNLDQGVCIFDAELQLVAWNRRFVELLGLPEPLVAAGARFADVVRHQAERGELGPGEVDEIVAERAAAARHSPRFYSERTTLAGRILGAQTDPLDGGGFVTVYTDITERSMAEILTPARRDELEARVHQRTLELRTVNDELRENIRRLEEASAAREKGEARLRLICDAIPAAIAYLDDRLTLQFANRYLSRLFQRPGDQVVGLSAAQLLGDELLAEVAEHLDRALCGEVVAFEHTHRAPSGATVITRNTLIPERTASGGVAGLFALSLDVTEEKRAERALHEAQKMSAIGQLAGGLAHDFNNLLTVIVGGLSALGERLDQELVREYVAPALRASSRGAGITGRLLAFARQQSLEPMPVDVPGLIAGTAQLLRRSLPSTITIHCNAGDNGWPALVDPAQLENAIINLALNARDAMPEGGILTFSTSYERLADGDRGRDHVKLSVRDTGSGIAPDVLARVVEPFFTTKPFGSGSGLGLSMVFGFVRQSGGDLHIESEVGRGTCVSLLLPRAEGAVAAMPAFEDQPVVAAQGELVLLVEDHDDVRQTVRRQLLELGYRVLEARDAEDAASLLAAVPDVSILVSDIIMPGPVDGIGLAEQARRLIPGIRVLLISGFSAASPPPPGGTGEQTDGRVVLRKPFHKEALARALQRANP